LENLARISDSAGAGLSGCSFSPEVNMPILAVQHLTKRFSGIPVVDDVSFVMERGEILGYIGANGAGKSTTVKMIIGLLSPSYGQIIWNGRNITDDLTGFQQRLGYVPEEPHVYSFLSGSEYLRLLGRLRGMTRTILEFKVERFLKLFGLWEDRECPLSSYSKGMRQKILISGALMHNPELLIFDEPLAGLDVNMIIALRHIVQELRQRGKTIFYCSHVLDDMEKLCSRVLILKKGRVLADDSIGHLREVREQSSLEGVFASFTKEEDEQNLAHSVIEVMQS
jgi:ABC-2 type transport system ATP-binding protein